MITDLDTARRLFRRNELNEFALSPDEQRVLGAALYDYRMTLAGPNWQEEGNRSMDEALTHAHGHPVTAGNPHVDMDRATRTTASAADSPGVVPARTEEPWAGGDR